MFGFGRSKFPIDDDEADWLLACFAWAAAEFGGVEDLPNRMVILPDETFYPPSRLTGHDRAVELFDQTRRHAGMSDWPCELRAGASDRERSIATGHALRHHSRQPLGTFGYENGHYVITYNPTSLAYPQTLVATLAHELAHYLIHTAQRRAPGGAALAEHATDLGAVFLGFGVFMANSAKTFRQFQSASEQGWEMSAAGYLSENALVTALAMYVRLARADPAPVIRELKDYLHGVFRKALAATDRCYPDLVAAVQAVDLSDWA